MKEKCTKFEGMFVFANEKDFEKHLGSCDDCKEEAKKMDDISKLIQKAKPFYFKERARQKSIMASCAIFLVFLTTGIFSVLNYNNALLDTIKYGHALSAEDLGFPVDSYGLIMVENEF